MKTQLRLYVPAVENNVQYSCRVLKPVKTWNTAGSSDTSGLYNV